MAAVRRRDLLDLGTVVNMAVADPKELQKASKEQAQPEPADGNGGFVNEKWW